MIALRRAVSSRWASLPLGWRLTLVSVAVLTVILALFGSILYSSLSTTLLDTIAGSMDAAAGSVVNAEAHQALPSPNRTAAPTRSPGDSFPPGRHGDPAFVIPPGATDAGSRVYFNIVDLLTAPMMSATVLDPNGAVIVSGPTVQPFPTVPSPLLTSALYQQVATIRQARHIVVRTADGAVLAELIPLLQPTDAGVHAIAVLQVNSSLQLADSLLGRLRLLLIAGTVLAAAATVALTIPLIRAVLRPLRRMASASRAIASGDLQQRVSLPPSRDELADLAVAFNEMVSQLVALLATQRRFLADASHELRTPLTALAGGLEMLLLNADHADPAARARLLRLMQGEAARMGRLVDDLLTLTRLDTRGKDALTIARVDLNALASQVVDETRLLAPELDVTLAPAPGDPTVPGDADRLHQVLLNLCANARAHTPPPGAITVSVDTMPDADGNPAARLRVADTGAGIAAADLPHIWDRFYRADQSRERHAGGGLGLGLAIVRAIVENHGGSVQIASIAGAGTTVTVLLPRPTPRLPQASAALARAGETSG